MTAADRLAAWRRAQIALGYRVGANEEMLWLCAQLDARGHIMRSLNALVPVGLSWCMTHDCIGGADEMDCTVVPLYRIAQ